MTFKTLALLAALTLSTPAFATDILFGYDASFDATDRLSNFKIDGDIQETDSQLLITNPRITFTSSKRGSVSEPLRFAWNFLKSSASATCLSLGASKAIDSNGRLEMDAGRVLIVELLKGKPAFNWSVGTETYLVDEVVCEK
jgi:hypothetical protein